MTLHLRFAFIASALAAASLLLHAQQTASIVVDANQDLGPLNRLVLGQNINAGENAYLWSSDTTDPNLIQRGDGFWDPTRDSRCRWS
jgi:hypothetical protein